MEDEKTNLINDLLEKGHPFAIFILHIYEDEQTGPPKGHPVSPAVVLPVPHKLN